MFNLTGNLLRRLKSSKTKIECYNVAMKQLILKLILFYQKYLSFDSGALKFLFLTEKACRFYPTCSEYTYQAIGKYGIIFGSWLSLKRILKCNPWNMGGNDPLK